MADIDLERKQRSWWPWVIGAVVAVLAVWLIAEAFDDDAPMAGEFDRDQPALVEPAPGTSPAAEVQPGGEAASAAVAEYRQSCVETASDDSDMGRQHQWTIGCLESMAAAMDAAIRTDTIGSIALEERLSTLRQRAADVRGSDPSALTHAGTVNEAFDAAADVVETYEQQRGAPGADYAQGVQQAADRLDENQPLLEQRQAVHAFFEEVGNALEDMSTPAPAR